jgi:hypothetical protein
MTAISVVLCLLLITLIPVAVAFGAFVAAGVSVAAFLAGAIAIAVSIGGTL